MPGETARQSPRAVSRAEFARLKESLNNCTEEVEKLKREIDTHVRRMAAMQAEIDHLRARTR